MGLRRVPLALGKAPVSGSVSSFRSQAGRLEITNAVLSALPTFAMCTFLFPKMVVKQIDNFRKHYLLRGSGANSLENSLYP